MGSKTKLPAAATSRPAATDHASRGPGVKAGAPAESEAGLDHWGEQGSIYSSGLVAAAMKELIYS